MLYASIIGAVVGFMFILCFISGFKMGQTVSKGKDIVTTINPVKAITQAVEAKEEKKQSVAYMQGLDNIMRYDGTPQKEGEE